MGDTVVRARIDAATKERATAALSAMGLSVSDAIRILMLRIADEQRLPFDVKVPNSATIEAMEELEAGKGLRFETPEDLLAEMGIQGRSGLPGPVARIGSGRRRA